MLSSEPDKLLGSVIRHDLELKATDGYPLGACWWTRDDAPSPNAVALINAGAGIASGYYERFAQFLAARSIPTMIYDYRGIGRSRPRRLRGFAASVYDWGSKDCAAALACLAETYPGAQRIVIGHSVGGFVTGFVTNGQLIDRMVLVGAHTGYWRDYARRARPVMYLLWHAMMPTITQIVGYFPGRRLRLLEDLPAGVAMEWANRRRADFWWNLKTASGAPDIHRIQMALRGFETIRATTLSVCFSDDSFGTAAATDRILGLYRNCAANRLTITPADVGGEKIGHFGFFRSRFRDRLWTRVADWLFEPQAKTSTDPKAHVGEPPASEHPPTPSVSPSPFPPPP